MPPAFLEFLIVLGLILLNGVFAMAETAFVSSRRARLQQRANEGNANARAALELINSPNRFLSTVQLGITLIGILAGAYGGATIAAVVAIPLRQIPWLAPYSDGLALALVVICITYLSLVIGELVPKRLALNNPERIATSLARPMSTLSLLATPFVKLLSISTEAILRLIGLRPSNEPPITEEEINVLIEEGRQAGTFEAAEQDMVERIFRLADRRVSSVMTHRSDILWLDLDAPLSDTMQELRESNYSRFPVCQGTLDNVRGMVHVKDLLLQYMEGEPLNLAAHLREPLYVLESSSTLKVLEHFKETGAEVALVIQEYGDIEGIVTFNDILQAIVGDISSPEDQDETEMIQEEDGSWSLDGMTSIDELKDLLHIRSLPEEDRHPYETLSGFVMYELGRIPEVGSQFTWEHYRFEVLEMDGRRVGRVRIRRATTSALVAENSDET